MDTITATETVAPWIFAKWRESDLAYTAGALQTLNPLGFRDADCRASYIRDMVETELNRRLEAGNSEPFGFSTGGFTVTMLRYDGVWTAIPAITPYTAARFIAEAGFPGQDCIWEELPSGDPGKPYKAVRVKRCTNYF